jgi:glycosyltransferase involved in cell wall biosynthesis
MNRKTRVGIDVRSLPLGVTPTGTWRVIEQLTLGLVNTSNNYELVGICVDKSAFGEAAEALPTRRDPGAVDVLFRPHQIVRPRELPDTFDGPWKVVLHHLDTILTDYPSYHPSPDHFALTTNVARASLRYADVVTTLTASSQRDIFRFCPDLEPRRFAIVGCGVDHHFGQKVTLKPVGVTTPFVLVIGAAYEHKNRAFAIQVLHEMRLTGYLGSLVLIGPEPVYGGTVEQEIEVAAKLNITDNVQRLGSVSEAEKWWLLEQADAVLYPSLVEGFGLIPFEAATAGTPCLAANVSSIPEVCGPEVHLETTWDPANWAKTLSSWAGNQELANRQVSKISSRHSTLSWASATQQLIAALDTAIELPKRWPHDGLGPRSVQVMAQTAALSKTSLARHQLRRVRRAAQRRIGQWK